MPTEGILSEQESLEDSKGSKSPWYVDEFTKVLIATTVAGGTAALLIPLLLWWIWNMSPDDVGQLRFHILCITSGIIAILAIFQLYWKNQLTDLKTKEYIEKNQQDSATNEQIRLDNVRAERLSRYSNAIENLAHDKATIRMGSAYTLLRLADEWLLDDSFDAGERKVEGQVIIDNLCAYIRSPFPLAEKKELLENKNLTEQEIKKYEGNLISDKARLREEQDLRQTILTQIKYRLGNSGEKDTNGETVLSDGLWSDFTYNFSHATFFYPVDLYDAVIIGNIYFSNAIFKDSTDFSDTAFIRSAFFDNAIFEGFADFSNTKFNSPAFFNEATFLKFANFENAIFLSSSYFSSATFEEMANFENNTFDKSADFSQANFKDITSFRKASIGADVDFRSSRFKDVSFELTHFLENADFNSTIFSGFAYFGNSFFAGSTSFIGAIFEKSVDFSESVFTHESPLFAAKSTLPAQFSLKVEPENYMFAVSSQSPHNIKTKEVSPPGDKIFTIPEGSLLFIPNVKEYIKNNIEEYYKKTENN